MPVIPLNFGARDHVPALPAVGGVAGTGGVRETRRLPRRGLLGRPVPGFGDADARVFICGWPLPAQR